MALADFVRNHVHGSFVLADGTGTPVTLTSLYDLGNVSITGLSGPKLNEVMTYQRRGNWVSDAYGDRRFPQITFTSFLTGEGAAAPGSVQAFLTRSTPYTANVSVQGTGTARVYAVSFRLDIEGSDAGADDWSTTFANCVPIDLSFGEAGDGDKFSFTLECKGAITGSLAASEI